MDVVERLLQKAVSLVKDQVSLVLDLDDEIEFLRKVLPKLKEVILSAEVTSEETAEWHAVLESYVEEAEDILDEFDTELARRGASPVADGPGNRRIRQFVTWAALWMGEQRSERLMKLVCGCVPSPSRFGYFSDGASAPLLFFYAKIANQIKGLYGGLEKLKRDEDRLRLFVDSAVKSLGVVRDQSADVDSLPRRPVDEGVGRADEELVGREEEEKEIMKTLLEFSSRPSVVLVTGMGGIGKTSLVRKIFSSKSLEEHFEVREWARGGEGLNAKTALRELFGSENLGMVIPKLKGKRFLVVLDDCWIGKMDGWNKLWEVLSHGGEGSKVLITSQQDVSKELQGVSVKLYQLDFLYNEDCLKIFENYAFPDGAPSSSSEIDNSTGRLRKIGKEIINKIGGVPLVARVLGSSLRNESREDVWNNALTQVISDETRSALMWSYRRLPSHLKQCFAFCLSHPKDMAYTKEDIVLSWIACGYVQPMANQTPEYIAENYFDCLVRASLIHHVYCNRMWMYSTHNLFHDLSTICRVGCLFQNKKVAIENQSLLEKHLDNKRLRMLIDCDLEDTRISEDQLRYVRILSFTNQYDQPIVSPYFGNMVHLRYLDLSAIQYRTLPESICTIYTLQALLLNSSVHDFASSAWNLPNLRHLHGGEYMKVDGLGDSILLQTISDFNLFKEKDIEELENLKELRGELNIRHLNLVQSSVFASNARLSNKEYIEDLSLVWDELFGDENVTCSEDVMQNEILENLRPHENLYALKIECFMGNRFPSWMGGVHLLKLVRLTLDCLPHLKELPPLGHLPNLEYLEVNALRNVRYIGGECYGMEREVFPSLKELHLICMDALEEWKEYTSHKDLITGWLPSLEFLEVVRCEKLRSLPHIPRNLKKLTIRVTGLRVLPEIWTCSNNSDSQDDLSLQELWIQECSSLYPDQWFRRYRMPSLVEFKLDDIANCVDLVLSYSRRCLKRVLFKDMAALESVTFDNIVPSEEFSESDHESISKIQLEGLKVIHRMTVLNCEYGKIMAGYLVLSAIECSPISLLKEDGSKFEPDGENTELQGGFLQRES